MFKKIIITTVLFITVITLSVDSKNTYLVFSEIDYGYDNEYRKIYLLFENNKLNTNNFVYYFSDEKIKILSISPYVNPIIQDKIPEKLIYQFNNNSLNSNLDRFIKYFNSKTDKYPYLYNNDYIINGININKVVVYSSIDNILNMAKKYKINRLKYSFDDAGPYHSIP